MARSFFSDMSDQVLSTVFSYETSERLYEYITELDYTLRIADKRWQKAAILALFSKHESPADISYQNKFFQTYLFSSLKLSENDTRQFLCAVYDAMDSECSTPRHKLYGSFYLCKLNNILDEQELNTTRKVLDVCIQKSLHKTRPDINLTSNSTEFKEENVWSWSACGLNFFRELTQSTYDKILNNRDALASFIASVPVLGDEIIAEVYAADRWQYHSGLDHAREGDQFRITNQWVLRMALAPRLNERQVFDILEDTIKMLYMCPVAKLTVLKTFDILIAKSSLNEKYVRKFFGSINKIMDKDNGAAQQIEYYELLYKIALKLNHNLEYTKEILDGFIQTMTNIPDMIKQPEHDDYAVLFLYLKRIVSQLRPDEIEYCLFNHHSTYATNFLIFKELSPRILKEKHREYILRCCRSCLLTACLSDHVSEMYHLVFSVLTSMAAQLTAQEVQVFYESGILNHYDKFPAEILMYLHALQLAGKLDDKTADKSNDKTWDKMFYKTLDELDPEILNALRILDKSRTYTTEQLEYKPAV